MAENRDIKRKKPRNPRVLVVLRLRAMKRRINVLVGMWDVAMTIYESSYDGQKFLGTTRRSRRIDEMPENREVYWLDLSRQARSLQEEAGELAAFAHQQWEKAREQRAPLVLSP